jgi:hypothetical protein
MPDTMRDAGGARGADGRRQSSVGGTSHVLGDSQARFCEGLGVQFPGSIPKATCRRRREAPLMPISDPIPDIPKVD